MAVTQQRFSVYRSFQHSSAPVCIDASCAARWSPVDCRPIESTAFDPLRDNTCAAGPAPWGLLTQRDV